MSKGMMTCKVCGRDFALIAEEHYVASDNEKTGVVGAIGGMEPDIYDAYDCPHCGCQNIMQTRKRLYFPEMLNVGEDETVEHDGCTGCLHEDESDGSYPCCYCKGTHTDHYQRKEN